MKKTRPIPKAYAAGYFCEFIVRHDWPPGFVAQEHKKVSATLFTAGLRSRATALSRGHSGTIGGMGRESNAALGLVK